MLTTEIHQIQVPAQGEPLETWSLIVQLQGDLPEGSPGQLVLMDTEYHDPRNILEPPDVDRSVYVSNNQATRSHFLQLARVDQFCEAFPRDACLVYHDNQNWPAQDIRLRRIESGAYLRLILPPSRARGDQGLTTRQAVAATRACDEVSDLLLMSA